MPAIRGLGAPAEEKVATAWTIRGAPHVHRRADLPGVAAATAPVSDASKPLRAAGIPNRLTAVRDEPYLRFCVPCDAVHTYERPFRSSALRAGLELRPGTSPPVLQPVPGFAPAAEVSERFDVVRAYLRVLGRRRRSWWPATSTPRSRASRRAGPPSRSRLPWTARSITEQVERLARFRELPVKAGDISE